MKVSRMLGRLGASGVLLVLSVASLATPSFARELGPLTITPKTGDVYSTLTMTTQGGCPKGSNATVARIYGPGFPVRGQNITGVAQAQMSLVRSFPVLSGYTLRDIAAIPYPPVVYDGKYTVVVDCLDATGPVYGQYVGQITFASDGTFKTAIGGSVPATPKPGVKETKPVPTIAPTQSPTKAATGSVSPSATPSNSASPTTMPSAAPSGGTTASGNSSGSSMNPLLPALGGLLVGGLVVGAIFLVRGRGRPKNT